MRAIVFKAPGGPEVLELGEVPDPRPRPGELLVRVRAAGVNRADLVQRLGRYPPPPGEPETLGLEIAGEVLEPAAPFQRGDRVMALLGGGGYAELARVPAAHAMPIPEGMGFAEAAAIPEAFLTAWLNLFMLGRLAPGEVVVVHAAASGVGSAALQLCRGVASTVLGTASPGKHAACLELGATHVLARQEVPAGLAGAVRSAAGRGADLIFDLVGASYLEADVAALGLQGRLCCISTLGGSKGTLDVGALLTRRLTVMGSMLRTRSPAQKAKLVADFAEKALPRFRNGELRPVVARTYPLAQAREAHAALERNEVVGKIVLLV
ncbi:MAG TPA: NAD(P)H-quinone oxidoreductase [Myxococcales bacterium]|jgi:putative PIG3 family NAD(P)H quinone oxidoreductase|nr:NAD(P)H-quinone oxidoreductase [Myxococcales bacterium]